MLNENKPLKQMLVRRLRVVPLLKIIIKQPQNLVRMVTYSECKCLSFNKIDGTAEELEFLQQIGMHYWKSSIVLEN